MTHEISGDELFFSKEAAEYLGITTQRLNKLIQEGKIHPLKKNASGTVFHVDELNKRKEELSIFTRAEQGGRPGMFEFDSMVKMEALIFATLMNVLDVTENKLDPMFSMLANRIDVAVPIPTIVAEYSGYFNVPGETLIREFNAAKRAFSKLRPTDEIIKRGKYPSASFSRLFGVPFETLGSTDDYSTLWNTEVNDYTGAPMSESFRSDLDLIIIQLGDNANTADRRVAFAANIDPFICDIRSACPDARIIWVDSWYQYVRVHPIILAACTSWGIEEVDIHSTKSSETMATSGQSYENEYGRTSTVSDKWITHPGDAGMAAIANIIIEALGL